MRVQDREWERRRGTDGGELGVGLGLRHWFLLFTILFSLLVLTKTTTDDDNILLLRLRPPFPYPIPTSSLSHVSVYDTNAITILCQPLHISDYNLYLPTYLLTYTYYIESNWTCCTIREEQGRA